MQEMRVPSLVRKVHWRRKWQPTPELLPGEFQGQRNLVGYSAWDCSQTQVMTEHERRQWRVLRADSCSTAFSFSLKCPKIPSPVIQPFPSRELHSLFLYQPFCFFWFLQSCTCWSQLSCTTGGMWTPVSWSWKMQCWPLPHPEVSLGN